MPKPVNMRVSYRDDGAFLLRLEAAVGKDDRQTDEWRRKTCEMIRGLALRLLEAEKHESSPKRSAAR